MVETSTIKIFIDEEGIFHHDCVEGSVHQLEDARENVRISLELAKGKKYPLLVNLTGIKYSSREARNYYSGYETGKFISHAAMLVEDPVSQLMGNIFMKIQRTAFAIKLFTKREKALDWLKNYNG